MNGKTKRILFAIESLDIGGMQKNLVMLAEAMQQRGHLTHVVALVSGGAYEQVLQQAGIHFSLSPTETELEKLFLQMRFDLLYMARSGHKNPRFTPLLKQASKHHVSVFEHNIFANVDKSDDASMIDLHLFLSRSQIGKYAAKYRLSNLPWERCQHKIAILPNIVTQSAFLLTKQESRMLLEIPENAFVVGSVCRPDMEKFGRKAFEAWKLAKKTFPDLYPIVRTLPQELEQEFRNVFGDNGKILEKTLDEKQIAATYQAMDLFFNFSTIGESFGIAILEAMSFGIPVVVDKKYRFMKHDNAQLEHIDASGSGFIVNDIKEVPPLIRIFRETDQATRETYVNNARNYAKDFTPEKVAIAFEELIEQHQQHQVPLCEQVSALDHLYALLFSSRREFLGVLVKNILGSSWPLKALKCFKEAFFHRK